MEDKNTRRRVSELPNCDMPYHREPVPAKYDAKTIDGPWANMCERHYGIYRMYKDLGLGKGQELYVAETTVGPEDASYRCG